MLRYIRTIILIGAILPLEIYSQEKIEIVNFDIGQGDATLIKATINSDSIITVLFDAGGYNSLSGEDAGLIIHEFLKSEDINKIDYLIISHYDADHIGGIIAGKTYGTSFFLGPDGQEGTRDDIRVHNVFDRGDNSTPSSIIFGLYKTFAIQHNRKSLDTRQELDSEIILGPSAKMICLANNGYVSGASGKIKGANSENEMSLSFILTFKDFDYLISGDLIGRSPYSGSKEDARLESAVGDRIKSMGRDIDVLHVNHHGADNTSESDFLEKIEADVAIISCGEENRHDHPRTEAILRLYQAGVQRILKTNAGMPNFPVPSDVADAVSNFDGHIVVETDGIEFSTYKYGYRHHKGYNFSFRAKK